MKDTVEELKHCGIPTFMSSPYVELKDAKNFDVAVLGVPVDFGASYRQGARFAPREIREYSAWDRVDGMEFYNLDTDEVMPSNSLKICDLGDIDIWPTDPEKNNQVIIDTVSAIRKTTLPLILGGDHHITYSTFIGCSQGIQAKKKKVGLLHFDAHLDVEEDCLNLPRVWHGNPFRTLIEEGHLDGKNMVSIGPREIVPKKWYDFVKEKGINLFSGAMVRQRGIEWVMSQALERLSDCTHVFVTFDVDSMDIAHAPGTGTPKQGGLWAQEAIIAMRMLKHLPVAGFDIVELNPTYDTTGGTTFIACDVLYNFLAFGLNQGKKL